MPRPASILLASLILAVAVGTQATHAAEPFANSLGIRLIPAGDGGSLAATETTQQQWRALMDNNPSAFVGDDLPVESVTWIDAVEFCRRLTEKERAAGKLPAGLAYPLPSEAMWERACRDGAEAETVADLDAVGWTWRNSGWKTHPVASKRATGDGFHDLQGNVREWCRDAFHGGRAVRGGAYRFALVGYRPGDRDWSGEYGHGDDLGFRVALMPAAEVAVWTEPSVRRSETGGARVATASGRQIIVPGLPGESRVFSKVSLGGEALIDHMPFELSPEFLAGDYPVPVCDGRDREYTRVVGLAWSGINTRNAYLRALEATSEALRHVADQMPKSPEIF
jgi:hypothetical protein